MTSEFKVITLCGSARFKDEFTKQEQILSLKGYIVLSPIFFDKEIQTKLERSKLEMLKLMHYKRIELADEILVINKYGYIGDSTKKEIDFAKKLNKIIKFIENK